MIWLLVGQKEVDIEVEDESKRTPFELIKSVELKKEVEDMWKNAN
jgi:hypothetical protein